MRLGNRYKSLINNKLIISVCLMARIRNRGQCKTRRFCVNSNDGWRIAQGLLVACSTRSVRRLCTSRPQ
ncbi:hypothetical protein Y032_0323g2503 [Ancylostoma ceylanicum]|uniref:Uncharacterized protein n=1 Tax=Ancylostoma ceylanicum TaxID=53326 RepID=A0A016S0W0_9BILA|nr:hypothetical protein Y032_0323g2503 [Ancylostoma ceylanicum]